MMSADLSRILDCAQVDGTVVTTDQDLNDLLKYLGDPTWQQAITTEDINLLTTYATSIIKNYMDGHSLGYAELARRMGLSAGRISQMGAALLK
jgi:predicted nuclease of predicted toxin-antitoxin system